MTVTIEREAQWVGGQFSTGHTWGAWRQRWICTDCGATGLGGVGVDLTTATGPIHLSCQPVAGQLDLFAGSACG